MRAAFQVLVIPYKITDNIPYYAVFKRSDAEYRQFVAGGVKSVNSNPTRQIPE
jgi:hypothetical protein